MVVIVLLKIKPMMKHKPQSAYATYIYVIEDQADGDTYIQKKAYVSLTFPNLFSI